MTIQTTDPHVHFARAHLAEALSQAYRALSVITPEFSSDPAVKLLVPWMPLEHRLYMLLMGVFQEQVMKLTGQWDVLMGDAMLQAGIVGTPQFWNAFETDMGAKIQPMLEEVAKMGVANAIKNELAEGADIQISWSLANQQAREWAQAHSAQLVKQISAGTQQSLQKRLADWVAQGGTVGGLAQEIAKIEDEDGSHPFSASRAQLIAQTESTNAYAAGNVAGWTGRGYAAPVIQPTLHPGCRCMTYPAKLMDGSKVIVWRTVEDSRVCTKPVQTPLGMINGCSGMDGLIISSGPNMGKTVQQAGGLWKPGPKPDVEQAPGEPGEPPPQPKEKKPKKKKGKPPPIDMPPEGSLQIPTDLPDISQAIQEGEADAPPEPPISKLLPEGQEQSDAEDLGALPSEEGKEPKPYTPKEAVKVVYQIAIDLKDNAPPGSVVGVEDVINRLLVDYGIDGATILSAYMGDTISVDQVQRIAKIEAALVKYLHGDEMALDQADISSNDLAFIEEFHDRFGKTKLKEKMSIFGVPQTITKKKLVSKLQGYWFDEKTGFGMNADLLVKAIDDDDVLNVVSAYLGENPAKVRALMDKSLDGFGQFTDDEIALFDKWSAKINQAKTAHWGDPDWQPLWLPDPVRVRVGKPPADPVIEGAKILNELSFFSDYGELSIEQKKMIAQYLGYAPEVAEWLEMSAGDLPLSDAQKDDVGKLIDDIFGKIEVKNKEQGAIGNELLQSLTSIDDFNQLTILQKKQIAVALGQTSAVVKLLDVPLYQMDPGEAKQAKLYLDAITKKINENQEKLPKLEFDTPSPLGVFPNPPDLMVAPKAIAIIGANQGALYDVSQEDLKVLAKFLGADESDMLTVFGHVQEGYIPDWVEKQFHKYNNALRAFYEKPSQYLEDLENKGQILETAEKIETAKKKGKKPIPMPELTDEAWNIMVKADGVLALVPEDDLYTLANFVGYDPDAFVEMVQNHASLSGWQKGNYTWYKNQLLAFVDDQEPLTDYLTAQAAPKGKTKQVLTKKQVLSAAIPLSKDLYASSYAGGDWITNVLVDKPPADIQAAAHFLGVDEKTLLDTIAKAKSGDDLPALHLMDEWGKKIFDLHEHAVWIGKDLETFNADWLPDEIEIKISEPPPKKKETVAPKPSQPLPPPKTWPVTPPQDFPETTENLVMVQSLGGSTGARLMQDPATGKKYVVKQGKSPEHLLEEAHADAAYRAVGMKVPTFHVYQTPSGPTKVAEFVEGESLAKVLSSGDKNKIKKVKDKLRNGFAADALMANWDVIGLESDNILIDNDGEVWRIDNGSSFRYRAQGDKKGSGWSAAPVELWTMRDTPVPGTGSVNNATNQVFGGMQYGEVVSQMKVLVEDRQKILAELPAEVQPVMAERLDMMDHLVTTYEAMTNDNFPEGYLDDFSFHATMYKYTGIIDNVPKKMTVNKKRIYDGHQLYGVTPYDENGKPFDGLRAAQGSGEPGLVIEKLVDYINDNGGNYRIIERYLHGHAGSGWDDRAQAIKYALTVKMRGLNPDDFYWRDGVEKAEEYYEDFKKSNGVTDEQVFRTLYMYQSFQYEMLSRMDLPNKNPDGTITLIRTEDKYDVMEPQGFKPGDRQIRIKRGPIESFSAFDIFVFRGDEVTIQKVPLHHVMANYFLAREKYSSSGALAGDHENEFVVMTDGLLSDYLDRP